MRRVISLFLPRWPTDRLRRRSQGAPPLDKPLVVAAMEGQRRVVTSVDENAEALGITTGMTVAHAHSLMKDLLVVDATPQDDHAALVRIGLWCLRYSPLVSIDPPAGIFIDVAGSAHLFHGEAALLEDLVKRVQASGVCAMAALADTPGCAWAMARYGEDRLVAPGRSSDAIASLPVAALRLPACKISSLRDVGIERIAQLASKPRGGISLRFGREVLSRLDQALGNANEALLSLDPPEVPRTELRFVDSISDPDDIKRVIGDLTENLSKELERRGVGARRLDLVFVRVDNIAQAVRISISRPHREPLHLAKLLAERLVLIDPGFGIETGTLTASWVEALSERQTVGRHVAADGSDVDVSKLVDTLSVRLGQGNVYRLAPVESEIPERSVRRVPALHPSQGSSWPNALPRPARLLTPPEQITTLAQLPDHPPRQFVWRKTRYRVIHADGPERINGEWWVSDADTNLCRDYYRVETADGARYWLFRDGPADQGGGWWLHGVGEA